ncbi:MAG: hypothetical protein JSS81_13085 [Acidobacteria bacterium]|nr:hypothetical protein [Acidobacteriota bacterium]
MNDDDNSKETQISIHIFSVSAALVGVCLTVIGIFRAIGALKNFSTLGDNILAIDALIFLGSCILAYSSLRSRNPEKKHKLERIADALFIVGLSLMAIVCTIIAYTFI